MHRGVETGFFYWGLRHYPAITVGPLARMLEENEAIDYICAFDWLSSVWPQHLWDPADVPSASEVADVDSYHDPFVILGMAAAAAPNLGIMLCATNAIRPGPAELMRAMLTLASATPSKFIGTVAVGEAHNTIPYGYKRSEGLARLEDHCQLYKMLWECDAPFDFDGKVHKFRQAYLGTTRTHKPTFWVQGGGPKLQELAAKYADGWCTWFPHIGKDPAVFAERVARLKSSLEQHGRDPNSFGLGAYFGVALHEDSAVIEDALNTNFFKWSTAILGRPNGAEWRRLGFEPPIPDDFSYSLKFLPNLATEAESKEIISRVSSEMVKEFVYCGTPEEVAEQLLPFAELGLEIFMPWDALSAVRPLEEAPASVGRQIELCRLLKSKSKSSG